MIFNIPVIISAIFKTVVYVLSHLSGHGLEFQWNAITDKKKLIYGLNAM